jgi:acyl carrier protein
MRDILRNILAETGALPMSVDTLTDDADLYAAGLSSLSTVHVLLAIESQFGIEVPDHMLKRQLFSSIDSLTTAVTELTQKNETA